MYLGVGHVFPPYVLGDPENVRRRLSERNNELAVDVLGHVFLTRDRAQEPISVLIESVAKLDAAAEG